MRGRPGCSAGSPRYRGAGTPRSARTEPRCPAASDSGSRWPGRCWPPRPGAEQKASGQRRLTRDDWITAALGAIADGGLAAVGVEPLAARLGATKGSFYWHFENRDALLEAAIRRWEKETTTDVGTEITADHDASASKFRRLVADVIGRAEQDRVGPALLASATHPVVASALERVTAARLSLIATVLGRLGFPPAEARRRALLAYSAYLGHGQLAHSTPAVLPTTRAGRRAYLDDAIRALTNR